MSSSHATAFRSAALIAVVVFCCGFSWGLGKSDPCEEARTTVNTLSTLTDPVKRLKMEETLHRARMVLQDYS
jgi:hypothetical protein